MSIFSTAKTVRILSAQEEVQNYIKNRVAPLLSPLQFEILEVRPQDIQAYAFEWLKRLYDKDQQVKFPSQEDIIEPDQIFREKIRDKFRKNRKARVGISGEIGSTVFDIEDKKDLINSNYAALQKNEQTKMQLLVQLKNSIFFRDINSQSLLQLINLMQQFYSIPGQVIVKQGDVGDQFYIISKGKFLYSSLKEQATSFLNPGEIFGEIALLYNTPRQATITSLQEGKLYILKRIHFNKIIRVHIQKKLQICERVFNKAQVFSTLTNYEKAKLAENLHSKQIAPGKYVIIEGEAGDCFYLVVEGKLVAQQIRDNCIIPVFYYGEGDYFGQVALIRNIPRQASVKAMTHCKLLYIERNAFKRILGSLQHLLRRNQSRYLKMKKTVKRLSIQNKLV